MKREDWYRKVWEYNPYVKKKVKESDLPLDVQEEVVNEVLRRGMKAYDKADKTKLGNPTSLLSTITSNEISREWSKLQSRWEAEKKVQDAYEFLTPAHMWSIEEYVVMESLQPTLEKLEEMGLYEIWEMIQMQGLTHRDVADRLGVSKTKVTTAYQKAMKIIKEELL